MTVILTVLVEGEPDEVIPEVLRHDNITHYLADGTFYCKDEVVEPLAADYRMPIPKARKIELPRLAASMLGCNYDEIIRRRKAYKRTRLLIETALVSLAAIALMVYVGWTFMRIQDALNKAQMNQARYLSSESQKLLEEGDFTRLNKKIGKYDGIYWAIVLAIYLGWSFITMKWEFTWIVWPIAGVLFAAYREIMKAIVRSRN